MNKLNSIRYRCRVHVKRHQTWKCQFKGQPYTVGVKSCRDKPTTRRPRRDISPSTRLTRNHKNSSLIEKLFTAITEKFPIYLSLVQQHRSLKKCVEHSLALKYIWIINLQLKLVHLIFETEPRFGQEEDEGTKMLKIKSERKAKTVFGKSIMKCSNEIPLFLDLQPVNRIAFDRRWPRARQRLLYTIQWPFKTVELSNGKMFCNCANSWNCLHFLASDAVGERAFHEMKTPDDNWRVGIKQVVNWMVDLHANRRLCSHFSFLVVP